MKKILTTLLFVLFLSSNAFAVTLYEALNDTYKNNTQLNAERENIKASEEDINISQADYMPSLTLSGSKSFEDTNKLFERPENVDFRITEWNDKNHINIAAEINKNV